jgi:CubicO group peptidase (beta-lactamase class C family)
VKIGKPLTNPRGTILTRFTEPLLYEPGTSWHYSSSIDWAGLLVERLMNTTLEDYMRDHIWTPLGIDDITFWPDKSPLLKARVAGMTVRDPSVSGGKGKALPYTGPDIFAGITDPMGGQGAYGSMPSYLKILHSILIDDEKLLKSETTRMMFEPQLTSQSREALQKVFSSRETSALFIGDFPPNVRYDWGLGGVLTMEDVEEDGLQWRRKGTLIWSGLPNLFWVCI